MSHLPDPYETPKTESQVRRSDGDHQPIRWLFGAVMIVWPICIACVVTAGLWILIPQVCDSPALQWGLSAGAFVALYVVFSYLSGVALAGLFPGPFDDSEKIDSGRAWRMTFWPFLPALTLMLLVLLIGIVG